MVDADDGLADQVEPMLQKEVIGLVDASCLRVVQRDEPSVDGPDLNRLEDLSDRGERHVLAVREERPRPLLAVRAGLALVSDDCGHRERG